jgi:nucleoside-diphosphate-sugar epimerase
LNSAENFRWLTSSEHLLRSFRAHGGERAVFAGTCAEYDWARATVCHESSTPLGHGAAGAPPAAYAACKIALQETLAEVSRESGLSTAWGRIFFQFGPAENPGRLVPSVIINLLMNRDAPCSHGRQVRSFLHAADVGSAFAALLHSDVQGPVNIGSADPISVRALIELIAERTGGGQRLRFGALEAAAREPPLLVPDTTRLTAEVGWQPRLTLPDGLDRTIDWWRHRLGESRSG